MDENISRTFNRQRVDIHRRGGRPAGKAGITLRLRHPAGRVISPLAVEPEHAPCDPPADPEPASGLVDRVVHAPARAVRDARDAAAEAARDRLRGPRAERGLADAIDPDQFEVRIPELAFLVGEFGRDLPEHGGSIAERHDGIVAWAGQAEIELDPARGRRGRGAGKQQNSRGEKAAHGKSPDATVPRAIARIKGLRAKPRRVWLACRGYGRGHAPSRARPRLPGGPAAPP